jgi:DNA-binding Xre family transcriptional regulator
MTRLVEIIFNELEKRKMSARSLAFAVGVDPATISNLKNRPEIEIKFLNMLAIIRYLFPKDEYRLMEMYIRSICMPKNIQYALEYCSNHRLKDTLKYLLGLDVQNIVTKEWIRIYSYRYNLQTDYDFISRLRKEYVTTVEMNVFIKFIEIYYHYYKRHFSTFFSLSERLEDDVNEIKDEFIRDMYLVRLYEINASAYMFKGDIDACRHYAHKTISLNNNKIRVANAYLSLGLSYIYESYELATNYMRKAQELLYEIGEVDYAKRIESDGIVFTKNYWSVELDTIETDSISEQAHLYIRLGEKEKALALLKQIEDKTPFIYYYMGMAIDGEEGRKFLYQSIKGFRKQEDFHYIHLPILELKRRGEPDYILEAFL